MAWIRVLEMPVPWVLFFAVVGIWILLPEQRLLFRPQVDEGTIAPRTWVAERDLSFAGDFPLNTHGGQLGMGQGGAAGGLSHVIDALTQLQGRAEDRQLAKADKAYVTGVGGLMASNVGLVLEGA